MQLGIELHVAPVHPTCTKSRQMRWAAMGTGAADKSGLVGTEGAALGTTTRAMGHQSHGAPEPWGTAALGHSMSQGHGIFMLDPQGCSSCIPMVLLPQLGGHRAGMQPVLGAGLHSCSWMPALSGCQPHPLPGLSLTSPPLASPPSPAPPPWPLPAWLLPSRSSGAQVKPTPHCAGAPRTPCTPCPPRHPGATMPGPGRAPGPAAVGAAAASAREQVHFLEPRSCCAAMLAHACCQRQGQATAPGTGHGALPAALRHGGVPKAGSCLLPGHPAPAAGLCPQGLVAACRPLL